MTRKPFKNALILLMATTALGSTSVWADELPTREEMWQIIQLQQKQIKKLEAAVGLQKTEIETAHMKIEATGDALEEITTSPGNIQTENNQAQAVGQTKVGGYAELHYNGGKADEVDLHRFVLFLGHQFTDKIRFFSELEVEHSITGGGNVGKVEMEQAFVEFDLNGSIKAAAGLQLVPVGILNEIHEPPTFYGVERNNVEKNILPTTWREAGISISGSLGETISYDLMMHSGLDTTGNDYKIRSGRQNVGKAPWKSTAFTARTKWRPLPGVELGAAFQYQSDITQDSIEDEDASATLFEIHTDIKRALGENGTIGLRALYAQWNVNATAAELLGRDIQRGWYIEPSYKFALASGDLGFFARYSEWDNEAGDQIQSDFKQTSFGINYWPHEQVVLKFDYQIDNFANESKEDNRVNLGVGLYF